MNIKKGLILFLMVCIVSGCSTSQSKETTVSLTPGVYTSTQSGFLGEVTVSVEVDEKAILSVVVDEVTDYPAHLVKAPVEQLPEEIVLNQSYNVDVVSGATFTSMAIKNAVKDCLTQAGNSDSFNQKIEKEEIEITDEEVDVLVVGGGGAGVLAALSAIENSDFNVMLIEKEGFLGGTTALSQGMAISYLDSEGLYDEAWNQNAYQKHKVVLESYGNDNLNEELLHSYIDAIPTTLQILEDFGITMSQFANRDLIVFDGPYSEQLNGTSLWYSANFGEYVNNHLSETNVDVVLNTAAKSLIVDENGAVIGVQAVRNEKEYTIYAKKVILATGGFANNQALIEEYAPMAKGTYAFCSAGSDGDGFIMAKEIGAAHTGNSMLGTLGQDVIHGIYSKIAHTQYSNSNVLNINQDGVRFCAETTYPYGKYDEVVQQEGQLIWGIVDSDNPSYTVLESYVDNELVFKANTIEELANLIKVDSSTLSDTVALYNTYYDQGVDADFNVSADKMDRIDSGTYYAFVLKPFALTSMVGLEVDGDCQVKNTNGELIENLYAAGDMVMGGNFGTHYVGGNGVGTALYTGTISGKAAKEALEK